MSTARRVALLFLSAVVSSVALNVRAPARSLHCRSVYFGAGHFRQALTHPQDTPMGQGQRGARISRNARRWTLSPPGVNRAPVCFGRAPSRSTNEQEAITKY